MSDIDGVLTQLQDLGMSAYEAKAYVALVTGGGPLNGYEVAKRSGVPRSTVYETLRKLTARGAAFEVRGESDTTQYAALPADALLRRLHDRFEERLESLSASLPTILPPPQAHLSHHMEGRTAVLERADDLIARARNELHISAWNDQLAALAPHLADAEGRGVDIDIIRFGGGEVRAGHTIDHLFASSDVVLERVGCRLLVVAQDRRAALIGGAVGSSMWALYTDDPAVVLLAVEFIRHDIGFQVLAEHLGVEEVDRIFKADPHLQRLERGRGAPGLDRRVDAALRSTARPH